MAELKVLTYKVTEVTNHPNADRLDLIKLGNMDYTIITGKGNLGVGDLAYYFPVDSVIPEEWVNLFGIATFYRRKLSAQKMRGIYSEGLAISVKNCPGIPEELICEGFDATGYFGVTKYEPPIPVNMAGEALRPIAGSEAFPGPEHFKKYHEEFTEGEAIVITEKIHGTNFSINRNDEEFLYGSHNFYWKDNEANKNNVYVRIAKEYPELKSIPQGVVLYGEIYGVQDLKYGLAPGKIDYAIFAARVMGKIVDYNVMVRLCAMHGLKVTREIYRGPYSKAIVESFNNAKSTYADHIMEGVVVVPEFERYSSSLGCRLALKYISESYALRKGGSENK